MMNEALIVIDVQNDFCPGGALAVTDGDSILPQVNRLIAEFPHVILTQDWHPAGHSSFASAHPGTKPFDSTTMPYGQQTLWPDHCIQGTSGADFHDSLDWIRAELIVRKGFRPEIDSYSAFFENDRTTPTGLGGYLKERGISKLAFCGLALDYCVAYSALDAAKLGFEARVLVSACRGIDLGGSVATMTAQMQDAGVTLVQESFNGRQN
ncbi:bifunctional nicotinamidase/pyrazinamidase [Rhizobium sp. CFBP 8762]|uniref:bifunctional nicotinamidase/pyrazinamidase n=1 Tax=Rhizobium sp. CFBP 8762 TaxID=2775279 RepID=UPI00177DA34B|nr:bifunctional nicotinamidase/pyrazinamidase [Rhizobium sp. CFBP 8762]